MAGLIIVVVVLAVIVLLAALHGKIVSPVNTLSESSISVTCSPGLLLALSISGPDEDVTAESQRNGGESS